MESGLWAGGSRGPARQVRAHGVRRGRYVGPVTHARLAQLSCLSAALATAGCRVGDADGDGVPAIIDCDDHDSEVIGPLRYYADADGDGHGGEAVTVKACERPEGFYDEATDCDDLDAASHPGGTEVCDGADNDCDGLTDDLDDDLDDAELTVFYYDGDDDGYGDDDVSTEACEAPDGYVDEGGDCDDDDEDASPATEWNSDIDGDGYGSSGIVVASCEQPEDTTDVGGDCDDLDPDVNPEAEEVCDGVDNDCDELTDDEDDSLDLDTVETFYPDGDGDGYGDDEQEAVEACEAPSGYAAVDGEAADCDDEDEDVHPGIDEECGDGIDNNCDGSAAGCGVSGELDVDDADFTIEGATGTNFGYELTVADLDADGQDDLLLGGHYSGTTGGAAYIVYGPLTGDVEAVTESDATLLTTTGFDATGKSLHADGDLDADGVPDIVVSAYAHDEGGNYAGAVFLVQGVASRLSGETDLDDDAAAAWYGVSAYDYLGSDANFVGDLDGDSIDDLALGAYGDDDNGSVSGSVFLVMGAEADPQGGVVDEVADAVVVGDGSSSYLGYDHSMGDALDLDADGIGDLVLGAYYAGTVSSTTGAAYLFYGGEDVFDGTLAAEDADAIWGGELSRDYCGATVGNAGDLNADGYDDLAIGCVGADAVSLSEGVAYFLGGGSTRESGTGYVSDAAVASLEGVTEYDGVGERIGRLGDVDADGYDDVAVGALGVDDGVVGTYSNGAIYVLNGPLSGTVTADWADATVLGGSGYEYVGTSVDGGDIDGDGVHDAVFGGYGEDAVYVITGGEL